MTEQLQQRLGRVRARQHRLVLLRAGALGLLVGSIIGVCLGVARWQGGAVAPWGLVLTAVGGLVMGLACGWFHPPTWMQSARAVDRHYRLKDRSSTALEFADNPDATDIQILQVRDALEHLSDLRATDVVPVRIPRLVPVAVVLFAAVALLASVPQAGNSVAPRLVEHLENIVVEAEYLEDTMLAELEKVAQESQADGALERLVAKLAESLGEMKEAGVDEREALAKLSEMQAAVAAAQAEFNMDLVDANMQALGGAILSATAMKDAGSALQAGEYENAAERMEKLDPGAISPSETKTVAEALAERSQEMAEAGLAELSEATSEMGDGLASGDREQTRDGAGELARLSRKYALRKSISQSLSVQLTRLSESKGNATMNGGRNNQDRPSSSWGGGSAENPLFGDNPTRIDSQRREEQLTGVAGEGPSQREVTHSPEGREAAKRELREVYQQYRKQAEEVLRSESLPLGHRQTIRQYFEAIRPENEADGERSGR